MDRHVTLQVLLIVLCTTFFACVEAEGNTDWQAICYKKGTHQVCAEFWNRLCLYSLPSSEPVACVDAAHANQIWEELQSRTTGSPAGPRPTEFDPYDIVFGMTTIKDLLNDGWKIEESGQQSSSSQGDVVMGYCVAVVGNFNRGKTFVLNRLAGLSLHASYASATKGLSFKVTKISGAYEFPLVLLDTAGSGTPLLNVDTEAHIDRKVMEELISDIAFDLADYFVVVVNDITWADQMYIHDLKRKLAFPAPEDVYLSGKPPRRAKSLVVIHNLVNADADSFIDHVRHNVLPYYSHSFCFKDDAGCSPDKEVDPLRWKSGHGRFVDTQIIYPEAGKDSLQPVAITSMHFFLLKEPSQPSPQSAEVTHNNEVISKLHAFLANNLMTTQRTRDFRREVYFMLQRHLYKYLDFEPPVPTASVDDVCQQGSTSTKPKPEVSQNNLTDPCFGEEGMFADADRFIVCPRGIRIRKFPTGVLLPRIPTTSVRPPVSVMHTSGRHASKPHEYIVSMEIPGAFALPKPTLVNLKHPLLTLSLQKPTTPYEKQYERILERSDRVVGPLQHTVDFPEQFAPHPVVTTTLHEGVLTVHFSEVATNATAHVLRLPSLTNLSSQDCSCLLQRADIVLSTAVVLQCKLLETVALHDVLKIQLENEQTARTEQTKIDDKLQNQIIAQEQDLRQVRSALDNESKMRVEEKKAFEQSKLQQSQVLTKSQELAASQEEEIKRLIAKLEKLQDSHSKQEAELKRAAPCECVSNSYMPGCSCAPRQK